MLPSFVHRPAASSRTVVVSDDEASEPDNDSDEEDEEPAPKIVSRKCLTGWYHSHDDLSN